MNVEAQGMLLRIAVADLPVPMSLAMTDIASSVPVYSWRCTQQLWL